MPSDRDTHLVVVVEDDECVREVMRDLLEFDGFRVFVCRDGREALKALQELRPSVLTLDLCMDDMDGLEVLDHLCRDESLAGLPVVVVSAHASDPRVRLYNQVKYVIGKPFDADDLSKKVRMAANGRSGGGLAA